MQHGDDNLLPLSALQHLLYCPRQCALIHNEQLWAENVLTVEGKQLHEKADHGRGETRPGVRIARGLMIKSERYRLIGKADVVEFYDDGRVMPVEYKRGRPKIHEADRVQLCAQGLCLEDMLNVVVEGGAIFYGQTRRRLAVPFDEPLRATTLDTIRRLQELIDSGVTPRAEYDAGKCDRCSLVNLCLPRQRASASEYLNRQLAAVSAGGPDPFDDEVD